MQLAGFPKDVKETAEQCFEAVVQEFHRYDQVLLTRLRETQVRHEALEQDLAAAREPWAPNNLRVLFGRWATVLAAFVIVVAEFPLNIKAFEVRRKSPAATYAVALFLGIVIGLGSHLNGMNVKEPENDARQRGMLIFINAGVVMDIIGVAVLRATIMKSHGLSGGFSFTAVFLCYCVATRTPGPMSFRRLAAFSLVALCGCQPRTGDQVARPKPTNVVAVLCLFGVMGSTGDPRTRQQYKDDFARIVAACGNGTYLCADAITGNTLANARIPVQVQFPSHSPFGRSELDYQEVVKQRTDEELSKAARLIDDKPEWTGTDIMNACLFAGRRFFSAGVPARSAHKFLVLFSDMIEQTPSDDFFSCDLDEEAIARIIQQQRTEDHLPNLAGVRVWVAGATSKPEGGLKPARFQAIERFWQTYFAAAGAELAENHSSTSLLDFQMP